MTEEEEIEWELELHRMMVEGEMYEWSKKPATVKAITKIHTFVRDLIWKIKENFTKEEDPPF